MWLRCASFNVLADDYIRFGDYRHVARNLLLPKARIPHILKLISGLKADVVCLQEVEPSLLAALKATGEWQTFWSQKKGGMYDGCLTLVRPGITMKNCVTYHYSEGSGHVVQFMTIEGVRFANSHIKYAPADARPHCGIAQARELLKQLDPNRPAVVCADGNDRPNGPVRALFQADGFTNTCGDRLTALIDGKRASIDLIAVRGVRAKRIRTRFRPRRIPNVKCPSDHIPVMARIETG